MPGAASARRWRARAGALLFGAPLALAFPRPSLWWLAFVALVPLLALVRAAPAAREAAILAGLGGAGFFLAVDAFVIPELGPFVLPVALLLGVTWVPWGLLAWALLRGSPSPARMLAALAAVPSAFVAGEQVRAWPALGGPWGLLGASQWNDRPVLALASVGGVWAVSFLVAAVNVAVAVALAPRVAAAGPWRPGRRRAARLAAVAALAALTAGTLGYGWLRPAPAVTRTVRAAVVQPGIIHQTEPRFRASETATLALAPARPDLVVWGESSVGRDPATHPGDVARLVAAARAVGAPILANVDAQRSSRVPGEGATAGPGIFKTSLLVGPDSPEGSYDKMRLVPFGEYIPLRPLLGWVGRFTAAATEDRKRGTHLAVLDAGPVTVGPLICFESAFPDLGRSLAARGADLVVVQSATTTFQGTWGPDQHASLAAVRAVESGRPVVQAAISGVSAAFDARGRRLAWYPGTWRGAAVVAVPLSRERTPYDRWGDRLPAACWVVLALAALVAAVRSRRDPHLGGPPRLGGRQSSTVPRRGVTLVASTHPHKGTRTANGTSDPPNRHPHQRG